MKKLILASSSPRRKELLENLRLSFEVHSSNVDERFPPDLPPHEIVMELAKRKAQYVAEIFPDSYVIGSDTIVVLDGRILGKPRNSEEAELMLRTLSGRTHFVYTGVAIFSPETHVKFVDKTEVG
ncbi:MAG: Maf family protein, partial [Bacillales bacterium]